MFILFFFSINWKAKIKNQYASVPMLFIAYLIMILCAIVCCDACIMIGAYKTTSILSWNCKKICSLEILNWGLKF
ncbi:hypothetical protein RchiOBHm_Chr5g0012721 [Rosa chinensis]|uniref:Uncharacterized protein n=1 Tax=Rosa chinensis TaxID=74649 RepID=A0A2P6Q564_ROSCH|nr:hypothetical protein RchiOBHm_Chr5g0012721 [Rosa chinensis]